MVLVVLGSLLVLIGLFMYFSKQKEKNISLNKNSVHELVSGIAHEINNPLAILHGKSQILLNRLEKEENKKIAQDIVDTIEKIDNIISNLRYFMTDDSHNPYEVVNLESLINNVKLISLDRSRKENVKVDINILSKVEIECKPMQISQVLANLVNNSFDALKGTNNPWIRIETTLDKENIIFSVIDSGLGISVNEGEKILEKFHTSKRLTKNGGMGIGLKISKRIIENHQGTLNIDYKSSNTKFDVKIPIKRVYA